MEKRSILLSVKPEWLVKILNGEKTIEIRKTMPKCDLPIDVYLYCCKGKKHHLFLPPEYFIFPEDETSQPYCDIKPILDIDEMLDGKVVAKFTLNKNDKAELERINYSTEDYGYRFNDEILIKTCLTEEQLESYLLSKDGIGYAWYIDNLQIFDKPISLTENDFGNPKTNIAITKAPQSWCYCIYDKSGFMPF